MQGRSAETRQGRDVRLATKRARDQDGVFQVQAAGTLLAAEAVKVLPAAKLAKARVGLRHTMLGRPTKFV